MKSFLSRISLFILGVMAIILLATFVVPYNPDGFFREQMVKDRMLSDEERDPSLILLGGSNVVFGFKSGIIEDSLGINVINAGLHAGLGLDFIMKNCARFLKENDVLIVSPEYEHFTGKTAFGELDALGHLVLINPKEYLPLLNTRQVLLTLKSIPSYLKSCLDYWWDYLHDRGISDTCYKMSAFNFKGDIDSVDENNSLASPVPMQDTSLNHLFTRSFVRDVSKLKEKGIRVFIWPPSEAVSSFLFDLETIDAIGKEFKQLGISPLCDWGDCAYPDSFFYDTKYHMNTRGAVINSLHLVKGLKGQRED